MTIQRARRIAVLAWILALAPAGAAFAVEPPAADEIVVAQAGTPQGGALEPRYQPAPIEEKSSYNSDYLFGMTRGVSHSTIHPAGKAPLFLLTVPLDIILLPVTLIGGFFG